MEHFDGVVMAGASTMRSPLDEDLSITAMWVLQSVAKRLAGAPDSVNSDIFDPAASAHKVTSICTCWPTLYTLDTMPPLGFDVHLMAGQCEKQSRKAKTGLRHCCRSLRGAPRARSRRAAQRQGPPPARRSAAQRPKRGARSFRPTPLWPGMTPGRGWQTPPARPSW